MVVVLVRGCVRTLRRGERLGNPCRKAGIEQMCRYVDLNLDMVGEGGSARVREGRERLPSPPSSSTGSSRCLQQLTMG